MNYKFVCCVVLYNPNDKDLVKIDNYKKIFDSFYIYDITDSLN